MFKNLFDLSYERDIHEAKIFYFVYFLLACFLAATFRFSADSLLPQIQFVLTFGMPFIFYTLISASIIFKKELKDFRSLCLMFYTISLTLMAPLCLAWASFMWSNFLHASFIQECGMAFRICFFPSLVLGCIPVAFLSMKEDHSLSKEIQQIEQENFEREKRIEKQLLTERTNKSKLEEIKKASQKKNGDLNGKE